MMPEHNPTPDESLLAAIEGNEAGMAREDLILTVRMLTRGRALWRKEAEELWAVLVALKRSMDPHANNPAKLEVSRLDWERTVKLALQARGSEARDNPELAKEIPE